MDGFYFPKSLQVFDRLNEAAWRFNTKRYTIVFVAAEEGQSPEEHFSDPQDVAFASNGDLAHWFSAGVAVYRDDRLVAQTWLGGCYNSIGEFCGGHRDPNPLNRNCSIMRRARRKARRAAISICHYFPDLIREVLAEARAGEALATMTYPLCKR